VDILQRFPGLTALVVDADDIARRELAELLAEDLRIGTVFEAADAISALRIVHDRKMLSRLDVAFLDIGLPGLNGLELARVLRSIVDPPSIVFATDFDDRAVAAFDVGAVDYLLKPVDPERVINAVDRIVDRTALERGMRSVADTMTQGEARKVFLCHAAADKGRVRGLYNAVVRVSTEHQRAAL
jgi:DNA-binding LytR/AlgR family response regulator